MGANQRQRSRHSHIRAVVLPEEERQGDNHAHSSRARERRPIDVAPEDGNGERVDEQLRIVIEARLDEDQKQGRHDPDEQRSRRPRREQKQQPAATPSSPVVSRNSGESVRSKTICTGAESASVSDLPSWTKSRTGRSPSTICCALD